MRSPWPTGGCCAQRKKLFYLILCSTVPVSVNVVAVTAKLIYMVKKRLNVALLGFFNTAAVRPIVFLPPTSSRIHLQRRHASYRYARPLPAKAGTITKAGTWEILFYFPSEGRHTEDFPDTRKIQRLLLGLNPRTRVPVASMLTTRPPKLSLYRVKAKPLFRQTVKEVFNH